MKYIIKAALAGFGFSLGRDIYKGVKKDPLPLLMVVTYTLIILPAFILPILIRQSVVWIVRNYKSIYQGIAIRTASIIILFLVSSCLLLGPILINQNQESIPDNYQTLISYLIFIPIVTVYIVRYLLSYIPSSFISFLDPVLDPICASVFNIYLHVVRWLIKTLNMFVDSSHVLAIDVATFANNIVREGHIIFATIFIFYVMLVVSGFMAGLSQRKKRRLMWEREG